VAANVLPRSLGQVIWDAFAARYGDGKRSIALVRTGQMRGWLAACLPACLPACLAQTLPEEGTEAATCTSQPACAAITLNASCQL